MDQSLKIQAQLISEAKSRFFLLFSGEVGKKRGRPPMDQKRRKLEAEMEIQWCQKQRELLNSGNSSGNNDRSKIDEREKKAKDEIKKANEAEKRGESQQRTDSDRKTAIKVYSTSTSTNYGR